MLAPTGGAAPQPFVAANHDERFDVKDAAPGIAGVVSITGASSNSGKTGAAVRSIRALKELGHQVTALKITRTHTTRCPRENDDCGVCESLEDDYEIVTAIDRLDVRGKDTGRYVEAGADQVLWLLVRPAATATGVRAVLKMVTPGHVLVAEGNSFRDVASADLTLMAVSERERTKPSAYAILERIDAVVVCGAVGPRAEEVAEVISGERHPFVQAEDLAAWLRNALETRGIVFGPK